MQARDRTAFGLAGALSLMVLSGCTFSHQGYSVYSNVRRVYESDAAPLAKLALAPLYAIPDTIALPVTIYADVTRHPPRSDDGVIYSSFMGTRVTARPKPGTGEARKWVIYPASVVALALDLVSFPVTGSIDLARSVHRIFWSPSPPPTAATLAPRLAQPTTSAARTARP